MKDNNAPSQKKKQLLDARKTPPPFCNWLRKLDSFCFEDVRVLMSMNTVSSEGWRLVWRHREHRFRKYRLKCVQVSIVYHMSYSTPH